MNVYASDLNTYTFCPRAIYLSRVLQIKPQLSEELLRGVFEHSFRKELSIRQPRILKRISKTSEIRDNIKREIDSIIDDFPFIYRSIISKTNYDCRKFLKEIKEEMKNEIDIISENIESMIKENGIEETLRKITPWKTEYIIKSNALGISGRIDKIMKENNTYIPIEIKTGKSPEPPTTAWWGDKLQVCAYAMLLEEKLNPKNSINYCFVEYTKSYKKYPVIVTERLRREVIDTRNKIISIITGRISDIPNNENGKKCENCLYQRQCYEIKYA